MLVPTFTLTALATLAHANQIAHPALVQHNLLPRQTGDLADAACAAELLGIAASIPTPPAALLTADVATITDPCSYTAPASLAADYSSYQSEFLSWASANEPKISSALAKCPEFADEIASASNAILCSTSAPVLGGGSNAPAPTGSAGGSGAGTPTGGSGSNQSTAGGPRETGFVVGVMAVAGLVGAVAAL